MDNLGDRFADRCQILPYVCQGLIFTNECHKFGVQKNLAVKKHQNFGAISDNFMA